MPPITLTPSEIAIRIAAAMGWERHDGPLFSRFYDKSHDRYYAIPMFPGECHGHWSPATSAHDAIDLLEMVRAMGWRYGIDAEPNGSILVKLYRPRPLVSESFRNPSFSRAAIAVMMALEGK